MQDVHKQMFKLQKERVQDPLFVAATEKAKETCFVFLDEFQVNDVVDAMLIQRLFNLMW